MFVVGFMVDLIGVEGVGCVWFVLLVLVVDVVVVLGGGVMCSIWLILIVLGFVIWF